MLAPQGNVLIFSAQQCLKPLRAEMIFLSCICTCKIDHNAAAAGCPKYPAAAAAAAPAAAAVAAAAAPAAAAVAAAAA